MIIYAFVHFAFDRYVGAVIQHYTCQWWWKIMTHVDDKYLLFGNDEGHELSKSSVQLNQVDWKKCYAWTWDMT